MRTKFEQHLAGCDGCSTYLSQTQQMIAELRGLSVRDAQSTPEQTH
jgi:anti-sigma factor RsiW